MPKKKCIVCNKVFHVPPCRTKSAKYCSKICHDKNMIGHPAPKSAFKKGQPPWNKGLGGIHLSPKSEFKKGHISWLKGTKGIVRSNKGSFKNGHKSWNAGEKCPELSGKNHPNWKGGEYINSQGYMMIYAPNHPRPDHPDGYVKRCRLVMEKYLGRYLKPRETIHHINKIKTDDRIKNLALYPNQSEHMRQHKNRLTL